MRLSRTILIASWCWLMMSCIIGVFTQAAAETLVFHASSSGQRTLDQGEGGGNPFASALIETLARPSLTLNELPAFLRTLTHDKSRGRQAADVPGQVELGEWHLLPPQASEERKALVLVISDYTRSGGAKSLPGAKRDAARIATALRAAGFSTEVALDYDGPQIREKLRDFGRATQSADAGIIYTTGHGVEVDGRVYLIPRDYPVAQRNAALASRAVPLGDIAGSMRARRVNLLFYGGCRDNPFAP